MCADSPVSLHVQDGIARIVFDRPRQRNAFTSSMLETLGEMLDELRETRDCCVIVLQGTGGHLCAGWDFSELDELRASGEDGLRRQFAANLDVLDRLEHHPKAVLCRAEGSVMGFGFSLVARSDVVLAAPSCSFALPEIALGIVPAIVMVDAQRRLPRCYALDWLLSGRTVSAPEALRAGLVSRVVCAEDFDRAAGEIAALSHTVLTRTKALFRRLESLSPPAAEQTAIEAAIEALNAPAAREGIAARQQRREAHWPD